MARITDFPKAHLSPGPSLLTLACSPKLPSARPAPPLLLRAHCLTSCDLALASRFCFTTDHPYRLRVPALSVSVTPRTTLSAPAAAVTLSTSSTRPAPPALTLPLTSASTSGAPRFVTLSSSPNNAICPLRTGPKAQGPPTPSSELRCSLALSFSHSSSLCRFPRSCCPLFRTTTGSAPPHHRHWPLPPPQDRCPQGQERLPLRYVPYRPTSTLASCALA